MKCKACGYTSKEDFEKLEIERPISGLSNTFESIPTDFYVCPNCGTVKVKLEKEEKDCPWCRPSSEYTIIDDDFGQPLHPSMIKFCFSCGRDLRKDFEKK